MFFLFIIALIACVYFFYEFRRYQKAYKTVVSEYQMLSERSHDVVLFYCYLFFKMAANAKYNRKDFQDVIMDTFWNLPVRGGGSKDMGYWENILYSYKIEPVYKNEDGGEYLDRDTVRQLADAMWLGYDRDMQAGRMKPTEREDSNNSDQ